MGAAPMSSPQRLSTRQSVALVWRTLRSMRTALILLLLIALASVAGSLLPQWPNTPERVLQYRAAHPFWGTFFDRAGLFDVFGSWWFVLLVDAAVRLARRLPRAAHPRALAGAAHPADAGARDRRLPALRRGRGRRGARGGDRVVAPGAAPAAVPRRARPRPPGARRREGRGARGRQPRVPLGVHPAARRRRLRQGHRVQRPRRGGRGPDAGSTPRRTTTARSARAGSSTTSPASVCACATSGSDFAAHRASRWTSSPSVDLLAPDGSLLRARKRSG